MVLGIDASNIRGGGGITHLKELLAAYDPSIYQFSKIIVWAGDFTLNQLEDQVWLEKKSHPFLNKNIFFRLFWQRFKANEVFENSGINVLFVPGALYYTSFQPLVTMSHNMLPFVPKERNRYGKSYMKYRLELLEKKQGKAFTSADGVIFLTKYAQSEISKRLNNSVKSSKVIAHGIAKQFIKQPKNQLPISAYSSEKPFEILYVSIVDVYKHQKTLVEALSKLNAEGIPFKLKLIGPAYKPELELLNQAIKEFDPNLEFVDYTGPIPYEKLVENYHNADMFIFASSVENLPNILIEAMASGLPIACSNLGPMPEVLTDAGLYFDPENKDEIYKVTKQLILDENLRRDLANKSFELSKKYSWESCAKETFDFIGSIGNK